MKTKTYKNVYAKDPEEAITRARTFHLNDVEETEVEKEETVDGQWCACYPDIIS